MCYVHHRCTFSLGLGLFFFFFLVAEAIDSLCVCVWLHLYTRECRTPFTVAHTWTLDGESRLRDVGRQVLTQSAARVSSFSLVFYSILISDRAAWFSSRPVHFRSVRSFVSFSPTSTCDGTESGSIAFAPSTADRWKIYTHGRSTQNETLARIRRIETVHVLTWSVVIFVSLLIIFPLFFEEKKTNFATGRCKFLAE